MAFAIANAAALVFQVAWVRSLIYVFGSSVYAISTVFTVFMSGLALGSLIFGRHADKTENSVLLFAELQLGTGAFGVFTIILLDLLPHFYLPLYTSIARPFIINWIEFLLAFIVLIIPTSLIGGMFPVLSKITTGEIREVGGKISIVYTADTIGAGFGSLASGFLLIPLIGINATIVVASITNIVIGSLIYYTELLRQPGRRKRW
jgi:spermidine synthase